MWRCSSAKNTATPEASLVGKPSLQRQQRGAEHLLLEEGDLLIEIERVKLVVAQALRIGQSAVFPRVEEGRELIGDEAPAKVDRPAFGFYVGPRDEHAPMLAEGFASCLA